jgi:RHS repeat-associated protein
VSFILTDQLGQPQKLTDASKAVVWDRVATPYGETISLTNLGGIDQPLRFPGQQLDPTTSLAYNYYRDYDASLGRYIQSDPIGLGGGLNTYAYVGGNPITRRDRYGQIAGVDDLGEVIIIGGGILVYEAIKKAFEKADVKSETDNCKQCDKQELYRGDNHVSPLQAFNFGFSPLGTNDNLEDHANGRLGDSAYVATSKVYAAAQARAREGGNVYFICTNRGIDVNERLQDFSPNPWEHEVAVPDGIYPSEVMGAQTATGYIRNRAWGW